MRLWINFGLFILLGFLTACASQANAEPAPPTIHYGEDTCSLCGMIISEERFAAAYITQAGQEQIFDDIGDMFIAHLQWQDEVKAYFVHDYEDKSWIRAETAYYVMDQDVVTPMLHGLAAFTTKDGAEALAAEVETQVLTFDEVMAHFRDEVRAGGGHHHGMMGEGH